MWRSRLLSGFMLVCVPSLHAQYQPPVPNPYTANSSPASLRLARLSAVQGDVNVKRGETGKFVAALMNSQLAAKDHLQTSAGSRAEVEFDSSNLLRLAPNTDVAIAGMGYRRYELQLGTGTILYRLLRDSDAQAEIEMPGIWMTPRLKGEYRVSVLEDGMIQVTVRSGRVEVYSLRGSRQLWPGQTLFVRGNPGAPEWHASRELARDQLDDWSAYRDRQLAALATDYWKRFGDPGDAGTPRQSFAGGQERSGWHNFGQVDRPGDGARREGQR